MRRMTSSSAEKDFEGTGYFVAMFSTPLVVVFTLAAGVLHQQWWLVFIIGWAGSIVAGMVAGGLAVLLRPIGARLPERAQLKSFCRWC
jgi:hypothetical protein